MTKFIGRGVYGAIAIGKIAIFERESPNVKRIEIRDTAAEIERFEKAKAEAIAQLGEIYDKALREVGEANARIFEIHVMMIEDEDYNDAIVGMIRSQSVNAEYAVAVTANNFAEIFSSMDDSLMQARAADVRDISARIVACLGDGKRESDLCRIQLSDQLQNRI